MPVRPQILTVSAGRSDAVLAAVEAAWPDGVALRACTNLEDAAVAAEQHPTEFLLLDLPAPNGSARLDRLDQFAAGLSVIAEAHPELTVLLLHDGLHDLDLDELKQLGAHATVQLSALSTTELRRAFWVARERSMLELGERRIARLFEGSREVVVVIDHDGRMIYASPSYETITGRVPGPYLGRNDAKLAHPDDQDSLDLAVQRARDGEGDQVVEYRGRHSDGTWHRRELRISNRLDDPLVGGLILTIRDVDDRYRADDAIRFQSHLLESVGQPVIATESDGTVRFWNEAATEVFGWTPDEAIGRHISSVTMSTDAWTGLRRTMLSAAGSPNERWAGRVTLLRRDGSSFPAQMNSRRLIDADGRVEGYITVTTDMTEQARAEQVHAELTLALETDRARLAEAQRIARLGTFELDRTSHEVTWSSHLRDVFGLAVHEQVDGPTLSGRMHPEDRPAWGAWIRRALATEQPSVLTRRIVRTDGRTRWLQVRIAPKPGDPDSANGTVMDITELKEAELGLTHQARHDALTGMPNRTWFGDRLQSFVLHPELVNHRLQVALLDLDQFKLINDSLGHATGDRVLQAVARRIAEACRPTDVIGRFGGDEFVVVRIDDDQTDDQGATLGSQLVTALRRPVVVDEHEFRITASIGITTKRLGDTPDELLSQADIAMYEAKARGRDRFAYFDDELRARAERRLSLEADLHDALVRQDLTVAYQPVIDLATGLTAGFEALLRWNHPVHGAVDPEELIGIAEESGLIHPLGEWVLREAVGQLGRWRDSGAATPDVWLAVNLSAQQLAAPSLIATIDDALAAAGVPHANLHLEITESVLMDDVAHSTEITQELHGRGLTLSIDDFGTGYSSLSYLRHLPVSVLKIDRSFVAGIRRGSSDASIVSTVVELARGLDMLVVAEGVEDAEQLALLTELGCGYGQGFLWSPAVEPDAAADRLRAEQP